MMEFIRTYCGRLEERIRIFVDRSGADTTRVTNTMAVQYCSTPKLATAKIDGGEAK